MFPVQEPIVILILLMGVVLLAPLAAEKMRLPDIVLLLAAGALLGPNAFHILEGGGAVKLLGTVGLLYIMFIAGLEMDIHQLKRCGNKSAGFGLLTFLIPMTLGIISGKLILEMSWPSTILLASLFASHTLLAYPAVSRFGLAKRECVMVAVGGTMLTDVLALLVLAVIAQTKSDSGLNAFFWMSLCTGAGLLFVLAWFWVPRLTGWFFKHTPESGSGQFVFVLLGMLSLAWLSQIVKLESIIGAFLAGIVFNRMIPEQSSLMNRLHFVGNTLFIPVFLISVGMLIDWRVMTGSATAWKVAAVMVVCVVLAKWLAAWVTGKIFKYSRAETGILFGLSVPQAAATLAAVLVGYELKILDGNVLNGALLMICVSCPLGAWAADRSGRSLAETEPVVFDKDDVQERILAAVDDSDDASKLITLELLLHRKERKTILNALHVVCAPDHLTRDKAIAKGEKLLAKCLAHSTETEIPLTPALRLDANPADGLNRAVRELRTTLVLLGWRKPQPFRDLLFDDVSGRMLSECPARLMLCRLKSPLNLCERILLPLPPAIERRRDLKTLFRDIKYLGNQIGAELVVFAAGNTPETVLSTLEETKPQLKITSVRAPKWSRLPETLFSQLKESDLVVIPHERRENPFWTPLWDRFPDTVVSDYPKNNLLVCYPPLPENEEALPSQTAPESRGLTLKPLCLDPNASRQTQLKAIVEADFTHPAEADEVRRGLNESVRAYPLELDGDTVLLHCRTPFTDIPRMTVCHCAKPWTFRNLEGKHYTRLVIFFSPEKAPPEEHLNILSAIARFFLLEQPKHPVLTTEDLVQSLREYLIHPRKKS